ncbi:MAG TPA: alpha/beta fold hydrolase [Ideonella sp.]|jgi:homoserine O-acetyltransferase|nr:alpha/beta fold hydrolase [Ideonella sp.]
MMLRRLLLALVATLWLARAVAADHPPPTEGDYTARNFRFASGEVLPELRLHYRTLGTPQRDAQGQVRNAVLILHGTGGTGGQFIRPEFAGELFGAGGLLDASRYYLILPDGIGHGRSSKPSDGLRAGFPRYGYEDMVRAQYLLLTEGLGVNHLRLLMGTSMGGMHTWLWGQRYPGFMDALMPLASLPTQISGRNRIWRRVVIDAIRRDPAWQGGRYTQQPPSLATASEMLMFMSSNPPLRQQQLPTIAAADAAIDAAIASGEQSIDANDTLYQFEASHDYDPGPGLEKIRAPLLAVNSADDLINPPELGLLEREIRRVPKGEAIVLPLGPETRGHGSHTVAKLWKDRLEALLRHTNSGNRP